jgi:hypothetical protein
LFYHTTHRLLTRGQRLLELVGLVGVGDAEGVEVPRAADLELGHLAALLDLHGPRILPPRREEELLNLLNLLGLQSMAGGGVSAAGLKRAAFTAQQRVLQSCAHARS